MRSRISLCVFLITSLIVPATPALADQPKDVHLTILHTNDTHGHLLPFDMPETFDPGSELSRLPARRNIGGAARRATLIKQYRKKLGSHLLVIDAGDICDGTPFSTEYHGDADAAAMNAIGYDLACPGNHEFNNPLEQARNLKSTMKFPVICANVRAKNQGKPIYIPYTVKEVDGVKIAFLGLLTYSARTYPAASNDLIMEKPIDVARRIVPELRKQANLVVAVTHIGLEEDEQMAREVPGIDVIVGGHSHTMLSKPVCVIPQSAGTVTDAKGTVIVQDYQYGCTLGKLDLTIHRSENNTWSVAKYDGRLLGITSSIPEDKETAAVVDRFWQPISAKYAEVLTRATGDFTKKGRDSAEYHLVADAIRSEIGVEFDLENGGGVRAYLTRGPVTMGDLANLDPFINTIVTFEITGKLLKRILLERHPHVSGIRYAVDDDKLVEASVNGKPIEDDRTYKGSTNSYFAGTPVVRDIPNKVDTREIRFEVLRRYLKKQQTITPAYDGRRILKNVKGDPFA